MHDFHSEVGTVDDVGPSVDDATFRVDDGLVEVESIEVEGHGGDSHSSQPNSKNRPQGQEEVKGTRVVERGVLEDKTSEISVSGNNVVGFFFLSELVTIVGGFILSGFTDQRRGDKRSVHGRKERSTENSGDTGHVERMHEDVVLSLENQHKVKGSTDSKRHTIREGSLSNWVGEEDSSGGCDRSGEGDEDPRSHSETVGEFPLTAHVGSDTGEEMHDNQLVRTSVVQPFIHGGSLPDRVEVHSDGIGGRNHSSGDDVVSVQQRSCDRFTNSININWWCGNEGSDEARHGCQ